MLTVGDEVEVVEEFYVETTPDTKEIQEPEVYILEKGHSGEVIEIFLDENTRTGYLALIEFGDDRIIPVCSSLVSKID